MKIKGLPYILILLLILTVFAGCERGQTGGLEGGENTQSNSRNEDDSDKYQKLTLEELKEVLMDSVGIELKDTDNQAVGMLKDRELILQFVEALFSYHHQEQYPDDSNENKVMGPLNFYGSQGNEIYGLIKEDYIYIEGYYFLIEEGTLNNIEKLFRANIIKAPVEEN